MNIHYYVSYFKKINLLFVLLAIIGNNAMEIDSIKCQTNKTLIIPQSIDIMSNNIDELVVKGINHIKNNGELFEAYTGSGQQAYDVNYILLNPLNRYII